MSMSNRARRMAQHHVRHRADAELNLVPFIDILTVMVAFLLVYATQVEVIHNAKAIPLPESIAQQSAAPHRGGDRHQERHLRAGSARGHGAAGPRAARR